VHEKAERLIVFYVYVTASIKLDWPLLS